MSDKKISELTAAASVSGSDLVPIVQSSSTKRTTLQILADWIVQTAQSFVQSGSGATTQTVQDVLRLIIHRASYDSDANFDAAFLAGRTNATIGFATTGGGQAQVANTTAAVNYLTFTGAAAAGSVKVGSAGADTFVPLTLFSKGSDGNISFRINTTEEQLRIVRATGVGATVNRFELKGGVAGEPGQFSMEGSDSTIDMLLFTRGDTSSIKLNDAFRVRRLQDVANYLRVDGSVAAAGGEVTLSAQGSDTNLRIDIEPKGSGGLRVKGSTSILYINDTANAGMACGLTINQGGADTEILALKSSDVAHGVTTLAETDTYARFLKASAADGGLRLDAFRATNGGAFRMRAIGGTANTTKSTSGTGQMDLEAALISGTGITDVGTNGNLVAVRNNTTTRWLIDAEGDTWQSGGVRVAQSGTAAAAVADEVLFYSSDDAAGHTVPSFYCEGTNVIATGQADSVSSVRVKMRINGTVVTLLAI